MANTPAQATAIDNVWRAIQAALAEFPDDDDGLMVVEWTVVAATERVTGPRIDEDGDEINEYFNLHSPGLSNHAARGLLLQAVDRLRSS